MKISHNLQETLSMVSFSKTTVTWGFQKGVFLLKFFKTVIFTFSWALHTKLKHSLSVSFLSNILEQRWIANILTSLNHYMINLAGILSIIFTTIGFYHYVKTVQTRSFFWSVFSRIRTEYSISPYSVRIGKIWTKKNFVFGHFSHSVGLLKTVQNFCSI